MYEVMPLIWKSEWFLETKNIDLVFWKGTGIWGALSYKHLTTGFEISSSPLAQDRWNLLRASEDHGWFVSWTSENILHFVNFFMSNRMLTYMYSFRLHFLSINFTGQIIPMGTNFECSCSKISATYCERMIDRMVVLIGWFAWKRHQNLLCKQLL